MYARIVESRRVLIHSVSSLIVVSLLVPTCDSGRKLCCVVFVFSS